MNEAPDQALQRTRGFGVQLPGAALIRPAQSGAVRPAMKPGTARTFALRRRAHTRAPGPESLSLGSLGIMQSMFRAFMAAGLLSVAGCGSQADTIGHLRWPAHERDSSYAWPKSEQAYNLLNTRFDKASRVPLGSPEDIVAICNAIHTFPKQPSTNVREIRWLSSDVIMAHAGWYLGNQGSANYYYVVRREHGRWRIVTYYMLEIS